MFRDVVTDEKDLRALLGTPSEVALKKQIAALDGHCRALIAHAPFMLLATAGADGRCDVSPKGDPPASCACSTTRTSSFPTAPATSGWTACATSSPTRTWGCSSSCRRAARRCA